MARAVLTLTVRGWRELADGLPPPPSEPGSAGRHGFLSPRRIEAFHQIGLHAQQQDFELRRWRLLPWGDQRHLVALLQLLDGEFGERFVAVGVGCGCHSINSSSRRAYRQDFGHLKRKRRIALILTDLTC